METISVTRVLDSETKEEFRFYMFDLTAVFDGYSKYIKPKGKRTWKIVESWKRVGYNRDNNIPEPIVDDFIKEEAMKIIISSLKIKTWDEYKKR